MAIDIVKYVSHFRNLWMRINEKTKRQMKRAREDQPNWKMIILLFYVLVFFLAHTHASPLIVVTAQHTHCPKHLALAYAKVALHILKWHIAKQQIYIHAIRFFNGLGWRFGSFFILKRNYENLSVNPSSNCNAPLQCCILQMSTICLENVNFIVFHYKRRTSVRMISIFASFRFLFFFFQLHFYTKRKYTVQIR